MSSTYLRPWGGSAARTGLWHHFPHIREKYREIRKFRSSAGRYQHEMSRQLSVFQDNSLSALTGKSELTTGVLGPVSGKSSQMAGTCWRSVRSRIEPIARTTVQKMTGAIIILITEVKPSPSGVSATPGI